jgi:hypothetical protein
MIYYLGLLLFYSAKKDLDPPPPVVKGATGGSGGPCELGSTALPGRNVALLEAVGKEGRRDD